MSAYSIVILICSASLSHANCDYNTALDVVRGPPVDNPVMCALNAQDDDRAHGSSAGQ
jgi:hypothetical protein